MVKWFQTHSNISWVSVDIPTAFNNSINICKITTCWIVVGSIQLCVHWNSIYMAGDCVELDSVAPVLSVHSAVCCRTIHHQPPSSLLVSVQPERSVLCFLPYIFRVWVRMWGVWVCADRAPSLFVYVLLKKPPRNYSYSIG